MHSVNIVSIKWKDGNVTTGATGNIALDYENNGYTFIIGAYESGHSVFLRYWVAPSSNKWFLTAINPNTGNTVNNSEISIRYCVLTIDHMN